MLNHLISIVIMPIVESVEYITHPVEYTPIKFRPPHTHTPPLVGEVGCHQEFKRGKPRELTEL